MNLPSLFAPNDGGGGIRHTFGRLYNAVRPPLVCHGARELTHRILTDSGLGAKPEFIRPDRIGAGESFCRMKLGDAAKSRIQLQSVDGRWTLFVDDKSVISTTDRHWLRRFAVTLRQNLSKDHSYEHTGKG